MSTGSPLRQRGTAWRRMRFAVPVIIAVLAVNAHASGAAMLNLGETGPGDSPAAWLPSDHSAHVWPEPLTSIAGYGFDPYLQDPLGLVALALEVRAYSLDEDHWEVWVCDVPTGDVELSHQAIIDMLVDTAVPYFDWLSEGTYVPLFSSGGVVAAADWDGCVAAVSSASSGGTEAAFIVPDDNLAGFAHDGCYAGITCAEGAVTYPANGRFAVVGAVSIVHYPFIILHEMGHALSWPHSYSGVSEDEYDNPTDLMSGPDGIVSTSVFNRYQSGWIDPESVHVATVREVTLTLNETGASGFQMLVLPSGQQGVFLVGGARLAGTFDDIPDSFEGVELYTVDQECGRPEGALFGCPGLNRIHHPYPPVPDSDAHVLQPGEETIYGLYSLRVLDRADTGFVVEVIGPPFLDTADSVFSADIEWLLDAGITRGCNPPANDRFCPNADVTRGQMAAFLVRALGLTERLDNPFVDDDTSIFQADIEKLAAAGITRGCNPPANDRFCPDQRVTREQMAAFLVRALDLTDRLDSPFTDDDGSIFEADIEKLAAAGITRGCNPPANTLFCPKSYVTRGQMAAFLHRALG